MTLHDVALDDKFDLSKERVFLSGAQAIVRMLLMQRERDRRAGLNTAGFVSGYRGSPLGGLDHAAVAGARNSSAQADIVFQPGLNEELAATACWGTQQTELLRRRPSMTAYSPLWYGKGPGVDRSGDVFRHANLAGSSKHGGVLALMGDDHTAESSTNAHATEFLFVDTMIPILNPAGVQELIDYGLYGYALSRFAGTWAAIKCVKDNIEFDRFRRCLAGSRPNIAIPHFDMPPGGLNIRDELDQLGPGGAAARIQARGGSRLHPRQRHQPHRLFRRAQRRSSASSPSARAISTCARRSTISASARRRPTARHPPVQGRCAWPLDLEHIKDFARGPRN